MYLDLKDTHSIDNALEVLTHMSNKTKKWLISSVVTFFTAFGVAILPLIDKLSFDTLSKSAIFALIFVGIRAGIKALIEYLVSKTQNTQTE